jgi:hypothetical protein
MIDYPGFANVDNVKVPVALEPEEKQVVFGYDHQFNGTAQSSANGIVGYTIGGNDKKLPVYRIHIKSSCRKRHSQVLACRKTQTAGRVDKIQRCPILPKRRGREKKSLYIKDGLDYQIRKQEYPVQDRQPEVIQMRSVSGSNYAGIQKIHPGSP